MALTAYERAFWLRLQRRAGSLTPELVATLQRAFALLAAGAPESAVLRLLQTLGPDGVLQALFSDPQMARAFLPVRTAWRRAVEDASRPYARDIPRGGEPLRLVTVAFDTLSPNVLTAVRTMEGRLFDRLREEVRDTVRQHLTEGLREGLAPRTVARGLREVVGLAPNQEQAVRNFRLALEGRGRSPFAYALRDRRFEATLRKGEFSPEQIDRMVAAYRRRMLAFHAETVARTGALQANKLAQRLTWQQAIENGEIASDRVLKRWVGVKDDRERPEHLAMEGETVGWDEPFSNGEAQPGESTYNCRCLALYFIASPAQVAARMRGQVLVGAGAASF